MGQKTGWWIGGAVLTALVVVGVAMATGGDSDAPEAESSARSDGEGARPEILRPAVRVRGAGESAEGEAQGATPASVIAEANQRRDPVDDPDIGRILRGEDEERSEGYLYGQARRQIEVLDERITRYTANAERLRAEGNEAAADRQMRVVRNMGERRETVRTEQSEHRAAAEADGTLSDEEAGYDGAAPRNERPVSLRRPPGEE